jgi:hypothetical protein
LDARYPRERGQPDQDATGPLPPEAVTGVPANQVPKGEVMHVIGELSGPRLGELSKTQLADIRDQAELLISEKHRGYLPDRLFPVLLSRYRDDVTEAMGQPSPPLPQRDGQTRRAKLDEMTTAELTAATAAVEVLLKHARTMNDPALPVRLDAYRESLAMQKHERDKNAAKLADRPRRVTM